MSIRFWGILIAVGLTSSLKAQDNGGFDDFLKQQSDLFNSFRDDNSDTFDSYRNQLNESYAKSLGKKWHNYQSEVPTRVPKENNAAQISYNKEENDSEVFADVVFEGNLEHTTAMIEQPTSVSPIEENDKNDEEGTFEFYGTTMSVRWGDVSDFCLPDIKEQSIADAYRHFSSDDYNNLLIDCLKLRTDYHLCDWAYYKLLECIAVAAYDSLTNEAVVLQGVLLNQSGYKMRFAADVDQQRLHILMGVNGQVFDCVPYQVKDDVFYLMDKTGIANLNICDFAYEGEQPMSLKMTSLPLLSSDLSDERSFKTETSRTQVTLASNKNLIAFLEDYPMSYHEDNHFWWAEYANTPVSEDIKDRLYPQLRKMIQNFNQRVAVNLLLGWVQYGLKYADDEKIWGRDRVFFADETLFYPYSDSEDYVILFSRLVRDMMGLDVALVYYTYLQNDQPVTHLATAIAFTEEVKGDAIIVDDHRYVIADPTYQGAPVGHTYPHCDNSKAEIILLNR